MKQAPAVMELPPPDVTVSKPVAQKITDSAEYTGSTAAVEQVDIRARVSGYLVKVGFEDGQEVKAGDLLFEIDPRPYQAVLDQAKAQVAQSEASLAKAKADMARSERLLPTGAISREDYDRDVASRAVAEASLQGAKANVQKAELDLGFTRITSPIDGRVSRTNYTVGNLIAAGAMPEVLTTVVSNDPIYVYFDVDERTLLQTRQATRESGKDSRPDRLKQLQYPVFVGLANEEGFPHQGILDFADNRVDQSTGTIRARAVLDNRDRIFAAGMFVRVRLPLSEPHDALLISERAVGIDQGQRYVLVVDSTGTAQSREVRLGAKHDGLRVVQAGLKADESIIVNGIQRVRPGAKVKAQPGAMPRALTGQGG